MLFNWSVRVIPDFSRCTASSHKCEAADTPSLSGTSIPHMYPRASIVNAKYTGSNNELEARKANHCIWINLRRRRECDILVFSIPSCDWPSTWSRWASLRKRTLPPWTSIRGSWTTLSTQSWQPWRDPLRSFQLDTTSTRPAGNPIHCPWKSSTRPCKHQNPFLTWILTNSIWD